MSLREITRHTHEEIVVMVTALGRLNVIRDGAVIDAKSKSGQQISGDEALAYNRYLEEQDKLGKSESMGMAVEGGETSEHSWYLVCRRGWARLIRPYDNSATASDILNGSYKRGRGSSKGGGSEGDG